MNTSPSSTDRPADAAGGRRPARTGTIVWGLLLVAAGVLLLAWLLTDIAFDPLVVLLGLTLGAGAALLVGGAVAALGGRDRKHS
ncbi:hypothetical protein OL239_04625 [Arthrobacter sp. ATA002]|uniref:hypothetical protein n=1 Tax=Arthrobacter sp. ATA002 TaxID=2991715 RepID=UPI0022A79979|nr:hypothetical protein [Arthrobacter sp. ATA002]WAP52536.1 hypothetical protein OL239_04625 [Arthrobacter sp. ATA002]